MCYVIIRHCSNNLQVKSQEQIGCWPAVLDWRVNLPCAVLCSNSAPQKENKGIAAHQRVKELETQLKEERVSWARKESLHKNQLKVLSSLTNGR